MASITSIISIFVLLLATYCHSAPIGTEFQFSTVENELTSVTPKPIIVAVEFNTVPNEHAKRSEGHSVQKFTTERSILEGHNSNKRSEGHSVEKFTTERSILEGHNSNKRSEGHSVEKFTTERSILEGHNSNKRTLLDEFTTVSSVTIPVAHKRSADDSSEEFTTERSHVGSKRGGDEVDGESISEVTNGDVHDKRTVEGPAAEESEETKRSVEGPTAEEPEETKRSVEGPTAEEPEETKRSVEGPTAEEPEETKRSVEGPTAEESEETKRSVEGPTAEEPEEAKRSTGEWTTEKSEMIDGKQKRTEEHTFPNEFFVTEESSTDFNNRVVRLTEHEPVALELTTIPESSSFETLAHTTGLLKQRNVSVPKLENSKESDEKEFTTEKSNQ